MSKQIHTNDAKKFQLRLVCIFYVPEVFLISSKAYVIDNGQYKRVATIYLSRYLN